MFFLYKIKIPPYNPKTNAFSKLALRASLPIYKASPQPTPILGRP